MQRTTQELRKFGFVVGGVFGALALWLLLRSSGASTFGRIFAGIAAPLLVLGLIAPRALAPVHRGWMAIAFVLGWVNTRLILGVIFYVVLLMTRIFLFLFRKDPLARRLDPALATYWVDLPSEFDPKSYEDPF